MEEQATPNVPDIALTPVSSSQIHAIGHDPVTNTLRVQFKSKAGPGSTYDYTGVSADMYDKFAKAESIGRFFGAYVKAQFDFRKLPAPVKAETEQP